MVDLARILAPERIVLDLKASSKRQVLNDLAAYAADASGIEQAVVKTALHEREQLGSTGVGDGIALPHARLAGLDRLIGIFARLQKPIPFEALDDGPVDLVFLLLVPQDCASEHLKTLARIARTLRSDRLCSDLRRLNEPGTVWQILTGRAGEHAA
ncbi:MAG: PTS sugar transporter subunit IIA [Geminicoccaceae bacterium]